VQSSSIATSACFAAGLLIGKLCQGFASPRLSKRSKRARARRHGLFLQKKSRIYRRDSGEWVFCVYVLCTGHGLVYPAVSTVLEGFSGN
jgi:hypothetical protein